MLEKGEGAAKNAASKCTQRAVSLQQQADIEVLFNDNLVYVKQKWCKHAYGKENKAWTCAMKKMGKRNGWVKVNGRGKKRRHP